MRRAVVSNRARWYLSGLIIFAVQMSCHGQSSSVVTGDEQYPLYNFLLKETEEFRGIHNLFPDGYVSNIANDALKPGTKRDGYLTNLLEVQSYNTIDYLMTFNSWREGFSLSPIQCQLTWDNRFEGEDCFKAELNPVQITVRETYGHRLYTPKTELYKGLDYQGANEKIVDPAAFDRPFAGWAYYNKTFEVNHGRFQHRHTTSLGLVGEAAMGRAVQEWAHKFPFSGPEKIQGWETQVEHRIAVQYQGKYSWLSPVYHDPTELMGLNFMANGYLEMGNIIKSIGIGFGGNLSVGGTQYCVPVEWQFATRAITDGTLPKENDQTAPLPKISCFNLKPWLVFDFEWRRDYVESNYLIENGIHVPENVITQEELDLYDQLNNGSKPPINPILVSGGDLYVNLKPEVDTFTMGVTAFDLIRVGYMKRSEETYEQDEKHEWLEVQVNIRGDAGWLFIPLFLTYQSWKK